MQNTRAARKTYTGILGAYRKIENYTSGTSARALALEEHIVGASAMSKNPCTATPGQAEIMRKHTPGESGHATILQDMQRSDRRMQTYKATKQRLESGIIGSQKNA